MRDPGGLNFGSAILGFWLAGVALAHGWAGAQHLQITKAAAQALPDEMADFRPFSRPLALPSVFPDLWKETDPDESARHYFEPDRLPPETDWKRLPEDLTAALLQINMTPLEIGIAPWTIRDLVQKMADGMRTNDWVWAARCGAAMSHYAADLHMPLHCTRNFNGQETWQAGVHERFETDMTKAFFDSRMMAPTKARHLANPFEDIMEWVNQSFSLAPEVLKADLIAKQAANGRVDTESYYLKLWELTENLVVSQMNAAATAIASLWYTAWVEAGRPPIPSPFDELPPNSVFSEVGIDPATEGGPVGATRSRQHQLFDYIIWSLMGLIGVVVVGSSLHRARLERKGKS